MTLISWERFADTDPLLSRLMPPGFIRWPQFFRQNASGVRRSTGESFYGSDGDYCFVAMETQQNIRRLWFELVGQGEIAAAPGQAASGYGPTPQESVPVMARPTESGSSGVRPLQG